MIELDVIKYSYTDDTIIAGIRKSFNNDVKLFYGVNPNYQFFNDFIFVDIEHGQIDVYSIDTVKNKEKIDNEYQHMNGAHTSYVLGNGCYLIFPEDNSCFIRVLDIKNEKMFVYFHEDLGLSKEKYKDFNSGLSNYNNDDFLYFACSTYNKTVDFFKATFNEETKQFETIEIITTDVPAQYAPHDVVVQDNELFASKFQEITYKVGTEIFTTDESFKEFIMTKLKEKFYYKMSRLPALTIKKLWQSFRYSMWTKYNSWDSICKELEIDYEILSGGTIYVNMDTKESSIIESSSSPAHIEIVENDVYVSHHNFMLWFTSNGTFNGLGGIDKYVKKDGKYVLYSKFRNDEAYKLISSKQFIFNEKECLAIMIHPGKILIVDCETMTLLSSVSIIDYDYSKGIDLINKDLNLIYKYRFGTDGYSYRTFEISIDNSKILICDNDKFSVIQMPLNVNDEMTVLCTMDVVLPKNHCIDSSHSETV